MKILVTGVKGQLGYDVVKRLEKRGIECRGVDIDDFDLTNRDETVAYIMAYAPDAIIHCAAYTAVDRAEDEQAVCRRVNVEGTANVRAAAERLDAKLMYFSTDYVFSGTGETPFGPDDEKAPCNFYGQTKYEGEQALLSYAKLFILRISWVFGKNGKNFIRTMLRLAETHDEIGVVADQLGSPTYTYDLARLICDMIVTEKYGTYHATNEGICSWADLAEYTFACAGKDVKVRRLTSEEYPSRAVRPKNSRLDKSRLIENGFAPLPSWQDAAARYIAGADE